MKLTAHNAAHPNDAYGYIAFIRGSSFNAADVERAKAGGVVALAEPDST